MTSLKIFLLPIALLAVPLAAHAQTWNDDGGNRRYQQAPDEIIWDGNCRVERRINRDGEMVERRRCRGDGRAYARASRRHADDQELSRYRDEREPRRGANPGDGRSYDSNAEGQSDRYTDAREQRPLDLPPPAPEPVYREQPREVLAPRIIAQSVPVAAPRAVAKPAAPAPRIVSKPAPVVRAPQIAAKAVAVAAAPRVAAKTPIVTAPRVTAKAAAAVQAPRVASKAVTTPRLATKAAPVALAPRAQVKLAPARVIAKASPIVKAPRIVAKAAPAAIAPRAAVRPTPVRVLAKSAPVATPVRVVAKSPAETAPRIVAKAAPVKAAPRLLAKAVPAVKASHMMVKAEPAQKMSRTAAKPEPVVQAPALVAKAPVQGKPQRVIAQVAPAASTPRVAAKTEPVAEPSPPKAETVVKSTGTYPKSDWLVILAPEKDKAEVETKPAVVAAEAAPAKPRAYAKAERDLLLRDYNAYVVRKSSDPYSNLK